MTLTVQFYTMLAMIAMGSFFGATLDTYQRFLKRGKRKRWIVFANDLLFWIVQGLLIFYILYRVNYGEVRFYLLLALLLGFSAYQALFKTLYTRLLEWMIRTMTAAARLLYRVFQFLVVNPARLIVWIVIGLLAWLGKTLWFCIQTIGKVVLWILKIVLKPFAAIGMRLWGLLPKPVKNSVARLTAAAEGFGRLVKNYTVKLIHAISKKQP